MGKQLCVHREGTDGNFSYQIIWEEDFHRLDKEVKALGFEGRKICIVSDSNVAPIYGETVKRILENVGSQVDLYVIPAGESSKTLEYISGIYGYLIAHQYGRKDLLAALGGGVIGDMTGFAAATYLRGIDFIQIPTTLLSQVDSSVGGKTGVDFDQYKNMVGAFYQPRLVYMNMNTLKTLSDEQFASGMGEVLKTALIRDEKLYDWTINHMSEIQERIPAVLAKMIRKCCEIKADVVAHDPKESGERAILNFGHTIGHAIEKLKNFELLHGQCVALGTIAAAYISFKRGYLSTEEFYEIRDMNVGFDLPIFFSGLEADSIIETTKSDKKVSNGQMKFILLEKMGQARIVMDVTEAELREAIQFINGDVLDEE